MKIEFNNELYLVSKEEETNQYIYYRVIWFKKKKGGFEEHTHHVDYDKTEPNLKKRLTNCDCSWCSSWGIDGATGEIKSWCRFKKVTALRMINEKLMDPIVKEWIK